jgi:mono/diheme cytochrome c family protein
MLKQKGFRRSLAHSGMWPLALAALTIIGTSLSLPRTTQAQALTVKDAQLIEQGYKLFTTQTFNGNGRTCANCHIPQKDYNVAPADLPTLSASQRALIFATNVPGLENPTLVRKLALFNINEQHAPGIGTSPAGPFRTTMTIAGLSFTTLNDFFNANPPTVLPAIDDGTRAIELGWSGDGTPIDPAIFPGSPFSQNCINELNAFNADPTDLTLALDAFSLGAIRKHDTRSLNRVPGFDFRCPTPSELSALSAFQEYLGRQFELALSIDSQPDPSESVITFNDDTAETGKSIFLNTMASCTACHFNAGANDTIGATLLNPPPEGAPAVTGATIPVPGANKDSHTDVELERLALDAITSPVVIPQDAGDSVPGGATKEGGFNIQSIIEAPRKREFFHNGAFTTNIEDAISFYFTTTFDQSQSGGGRVKNVLRAKNTGPEALASLASTYFSDPSDTQDVLDSIGFFLRALSAVYSLADVERLTQDAIFLTQLGLPTDVQELNINNDLVDITNVTSGTPLTLPPAYIPLKYGMPYYESEYQQAFATRNIRPLDFLLQQMQALRHSVAAISPDIS